MSIQVLVGWVTDLRPLQFNDRQLTVSVVPSVQAYLNHVCEWGQRGAEHYLKNVIIIDGGFRLIKMVC
ncbi:hypothetical protein CBP51_05625 [Cellvibrio mixtus]|uniref:Uncharacterized protein n=1 Tax=Cellvibrio mixtus TaxID=39650 RepID=A0A266Q9C2_9GAMM|nr:hypothetical protein [Cellvibrio mixtus]OZY86503.1 hypothetical protein CBP51_05625 [Cellvibrio mixtus]